MPQKDVNVIDCILKIPEKREECAKWLQSQTPNTVADILAISQNVYNAMITGTSDDELFKNQKYLEELQKKHDATVQKTREMHTKTIESMRDAHNKMLEESNAAIQELQTQISSEKSKYQIEIHKQLQKQEEINKKEKNDELEQLKQHYDDKITIIKNKTNSEKEHLQTTHEEYVQTIQRQFEESKIELRKLQGENAIYKESLRIEFDKEKDKYLTHYKQEKDIFYQQLSNEQKRYETDKAFWQTQLANKDLEIRQIHEQGTKMLEEKTNEITSVVRSLTGSAAAIGKMGENFVSKIHAQMNLGTYSDDSHIKATGYADATWELPFQSTNLKCLIENKFTTQIHSVHDIKKFENDTRAAAELGRINASIMFSLSARIPGKPRLNMEMSLGVPTIWASRDADDVLPAQSLVEMGFLMMAEAWPIITKKHTDENSINDLLQGMANNIEIQLKEYEKMEKSIKKIEDTAEQQLKQVKDMRKIQTSLFQNINAFRIRYPAVSSASLMLPQMDFWENEGYILKTAIEEYKNSSKGRNGLRYPAKIEDITLPTDVLQKVRNIPNAFELAVKQLKDSKQVKDKESKRNIENIDNDTDQISKKTKQTMK